MQARSSTAALESCQNNWTRANLICESQDFIRSFPAENRFVRGDIYAKRLRLRTLARDIAMCAAHITGVIVLTQVLLRRNRARWGLGKYLGNGFSSLNILSAVLDGKQSAFRSAVDSEVKNPISERIKDFDLVGVGTLWSDRIATRSTADSIITQIHRPYRAMEITIQNNSVPR